MNGLESPLYYLASNVVSKSNENLNYTEENSHLCPESLPQAAGIGETELPLEPDEQPAEAEIQIARFWNCLLLDQNGTFMRMGI